jgi:hypothetical protein
MRMQLRMSGELADKLTGWIARRPKLILNQPNLSG